MARIIEVSPPYLETNLHFWRRIDTILWSVGINPLNRYAFSKRAKSKRQFDSPMHPSSGKSGKDYDPSNWAAQRRAAVEAAARLKADRKTNASEAVDFTFAPQLIARKQSPGQPPLPVEMDIQQHAHHGGGAGHGSGHNSANHAGGNAASQQSYGGQGGQQRRGATLDQLAYDDSLDDFRRAAEGGRIQGIDGVAINTRIDRGAPSGKENAGRAGYAPAQVMSPGSDTLGQEVRRRGGDSGGSGGGSGSVASGGGRSGGGSPFLSKFGQELYQEGFLDQKANGEAQFPSLLTSKVHEAEAFPNVPEEVIEKRGTHCRATTPSKRSLL